MGIGAYNISFSSQCYSTISNLSYCYYCVQNSSSLFGCVSLRNKQYCILNKQYTKEEYETLVPKIIQHMNDMPYVDKNGCIYKYGEFFPAEMSPIAYNQSFANDFFPFTKEEAEHHGFIWQDAKNKKFNVTKLGSELPDDAKNVDDNILKEVISCVHAGACNHECAGVFKITNQELQFYKKLNIPLPQICQNCRHYARFAWRNPIKLWHRHCMKEGCTNEFETSYAPDRPEIVYCEACYQQEIV